ncbi:MAG: hypothetical protein RLZ10_1634 [Bacteroidota bacterium]|jgi:uncharacterized protein with ParB-like and HNH nuclease domain
MVTTKSFAIDAKTCSLRYNTQKGKATILDSGVKYVIPIYQRPYSWGDEQLRKFISDIFISFWGNDGDSSAEPIFIGTMQLSSKNYLDEQEIIDGQQRLTSLLLFLKVLKIKFPGCEELEKISLDWLSTRVHNGKQQSYLQEAIASDLTFNFQTQNSYLKNALLINELLEEQIKDEEGATPNFDIAKFVLHILSNVYFVVIETRAGLSKTLQIFNAINTTGLDLNGGDIFKIRMYEYLRDKKSEDESAFDEISMLYYLIDEQNTKLKYNATDMRGILGIYQCILIAKNNLPVTLYSLGTDAFFERLFETIFNINQWEHFKNNVSSIDLSIEDIEKLIQVRFEWENKRYKTCEDACALHFIWWSRYSKYWILSFVFLYRFKGEEKYQEKMFVFLRQLSKLYIIYSIRFLKAVNEIHSFTYSLISTIINGSYEELMSQLNDKIGKLENHKGWGDFENAINGDIVFNAKIKNIICRLSAMLEEDFMTSDENKIEIIRKSLFENEIDIEHIQAYHDINGDKREDIWKEWKDNINSIGNLMVLEQDINRSIRNNPYEIKIKRYPDSNFLIVKNQPIQYINWNLEKCMIRKKMEAEKILNYIFDK